MPPSAAPADDLHAYTVVPGEPLISFQHIHLSSEGDEVLHDVSFDVQAGETKILLGETNTGKTVLMKMAAGLIHPDGGRVMVTGHDVSQMTEKELLNFRRRIGFVFQEGALFDSMTVADNVSFRLREEHVDEAEIEERVHESLKFVEMDHALDRYPAELSGGMRRRVSIARALIDRPRIVFYDSPTAGLDPVTSQTIINLILRGRDLQDVTSLLATHRVQDAFGLAHYRFDKAKGKVVPDRLIVAHGHGKAALASGKPAKSGDGEVESPPTNIIVLRDGGIYFEGPADEMLQTSDAYLKKFLESAE